MTRVYKLRAVIKLLLISILSDLWNVHRCTRIDSLLRVAWQRASRHECPSYSGPRDDRPDRNADDEWINIIISTSSSWHFPSLSILSYPIVSSSLVVGRPILTSLTHLRVKFEDSSPPLTASVQITAIAVVYYLWLARGGTCVSKYNNLKRYSQKKLWNLLHIIQLLW